MSYSRVILISLVLYAIWQLAATRPVQHAPGEIAAAEPEQAPLENPQVFRKEDFQLTGRARFSAEVRVLSRSRYRLGTLADLSPLDIAVGWGPMSDSAVLATLEIHQSGRVYLWHYDEQPPNPREDIETHSANWHLVPARSSVWRTLSGLRVGDVVRLEGMLVDLENPEVGTISTSLRRDDTGAGACEIVFVEAATIRRR